jgi:hypothetical protein
MRAYPGKVGTGFPKSICAIQEAGGSLPIAQLTDF